MLLSSAIRQCSLSSFQTCSDSLFYLLFLYPPVELVYATLVHSFVAFPSQFSLFCYAVLRSSLIKLQADLPVVAVRRRDATDRQLDICLLMTLLRICGGTGHISILPVLAGYRPPGRPELSGLVWVYASLRLECGGSG